MTTELFTKGYDSQNEDYCKVVELEGRTLVIMADGMGGLSLGAEAAECVCEGFAEYVSKNLEADNLWQEAFKYADKKLHELSLANHSNMGAAVTALIITETSCEVAWQGNVRLYLYRDNQLLQLTTDHIMNIGYGQKMLTRCLKGGGCVMTFRQRTYHCRRMIFYSCVQMDSIISMNRICHRAIHVFQKKTL